MILVPIQNQKTNLTTAVSTATQKDVAKEVQSSVNIGKNTMQWLNTQLAKRFVNVAMLKNQLMNFHATDAHKTAFNDGVENVPFNNIRFAFMELLLKTQIFVQFAEVQILYLLTMTIKLALFVEFFVSLVIQDLVDSETVLKICKKRLSILEKITTKDLQILKNVVKLADGLGPECAERV